MEWICSCPCPVKREKRSTHTDIHTHTYTHTPAVSCHTIPSGAPWGLVFGNLDNSLTNGSLAGSLQRSWWCHKHGHANARRPWSTAGDAVRFTGVFWDVSHTHTLSQVSQFCLLKHAPQTHHHHHHPSHHVIFPVLCLKRPPEHRDGQTQELRRFDWTSALSVGGLL